MLIAIAFNQPILVVGLACLQGQVHASTYHLQYLDHYDSLKLKEGQLVFIY